MLNSGDLVTRRPKLEKMTSMVQKLINLRPGELARLTPFFLLYALLFGCMAMADGVSLALFIQRVGSVKLPYYYGLTALTSLVLIYVYLRAAARWSNEALFQFIVLVTAGQFLGAYVALMVEDTNQFWYGALFVAREVSYTLILMHFGTYLQSYFSREELNRVLPIVYAGGRVGGIIGAAGLTLLSGPLGLVSLVPLVVAALLGCSVMIYAFGRLPQCNDDNEPAPEFAAPEREEKDGGLVALFKFITSTPLMFWFTLTGVFYMVCRWIVNFQYSRFFDTHFASEVELAQYIGFYSQLALLFSLLFQILFVSRLIERIGLKGTHLLYNMLLLTAICYNLTGLNIGKATFARFVETDLRFSLRNPVNQLITNKFSKATRVKARAITLGAVNPVATLLSSFFLVAADKLPGMTVGDVGLVLGVVYCATSVFLYRSFSEPVSFKLKMPSFGVQYLKRHKSS